MMAVDVVGVKKSSDKDRPRQGVRKDGTLLGKETDREQSSDQDKRKSGDIRRRDK